MLGLIVLLQSLTVAVSGPATSPEYRPLHVAQAEGYFAREGLAVRLDITDGESGAAETLAEARADLAATSLEAVLGSGWRDDAPAPRLLFGLTAALPVALLVPTERVGGVSSLDDLRGRRVGLRAPGAPEQAWLGALLALRGIRVSQVSVMSLGALGLARALNAGDVAAALVPEPLAGSLVREGRADVLVDLRSPDAVVRAFGRPTVSAAVFFRPDRRPDDAALIGFVRALLDAERRIAAALYLADGRVSAEQLDYSIELIRARLPLPAARRLPRPRQMLHREPLERALMTR